MLERHLLCGEEMYYTLVDRKKKDILNVGKTSILFKMVPFQRVGLYEGRYHLIEVQGQHHDM